MEKLEIYLVLNDLLIFAAGCFFVVGINRLIRDRKSDNWVLVILSLILLTTFIFNSLTLWSMNNVHWLRQLTDEQIVYANSLHQWSDALHKCRLDILSCFCVR